VAAGDPRASFLTVGTYSRTSAFADLQHAASRLVLAGKIVPVS
jgi:hypothetical protein